MTGKIEQAIDLGYGEVFRAVRNLYDFISGADSSFFDDAEIETRALVGNQEARHLRIVHADADAIAGDAGLGHLKERAADPVTIADADFTVGKAFDGEILAELPVFEISAFEMLLPVSVGL
jgi:hypothetical protein